MSELPPDAPQEEEELTAPFWMATYSDMVTLLLTFFVMIVAMSEVEVKKFEEAMSYFTGQRGVMSAQGVVPSLMGTLGGQEAIAQSQRSESLAHFVKQEGLDAAVDVDLVEEGIRITFVDSIAFASGSAELSGPALAVLARLAAEAPSAEAIEVEGHTDDRPIATATYPSNWELSAARAAAVVRFLAAQPAALPPARYLAVGYGEHRPRDTNETAAGRARNRRIAVLLRAPSGDDSDAPAEGAPSLPQPLGAPAPALADDA